MSDSVEPRPRNVLRASDADRNQVVQLLSEALGRGQIDITEYDERAGQAVRARTYADLDQLVTDLPLDSTGAAPAHLRPAYAAPVPAPSGLSRLGDHKVAVMSGTRVHGPIAVGAEHTATAFWGGIELDLREATFTVRDITLNCYAVMGGIEITVPRGVTVQVDGIGVMGAFEQKGVITGDPNGPRLTLKGFAFWGGIEVKQK